MQCDGVYWFRKIPSVQANQAAIMDSSELWHRQLGHPSSKVISSLHGILSIDSKNKSCDNNCGVCFKAKQPRNPFPLSVSKSDDLFGLIHCDIWGPENVPASNGARYFLTIVDDHSRATWVFLMSGKY